MSDYGKMKVAELRAACEEAGLESKGRKAELVKRLEEAEEAEEAEEEVDYGKMKVAELRRACEEAGISSKGKKADLVKRLQEADDDDDDDDDDDAEEEEEEEVDYSKMKVAELRAACEEAGISSKGKKADLIKRLQSDDGDESSSDDDDDDEVMLPAKKSAKRKKPTTHKVDDACNMPGASIVEDYTATLNQTNIKNNNNKFYVIQLLTDGSGYYLWTHWGRVGEPGQSALQPFGGDSARAISAFKKKFSDKTKNNFDNRENFSPVAGKYTLLAIDEDDDDLDDIDEKLRQLEGGGGGASSSSSSSSSSSRKRQKATPKFAESKLPAATRQLMDMIFNTTMFQHTMQHYELNTEKLPLGKLASETVEAGFEVLREIEDELEGRKRRAKLEELSSRFFTVIPHAFGRQRPPVIQTEEMLQKKFDMLNVLSDIEGAQALTKKAKKKAASKRKKKEEEAAATEEVLEPNPTDEKYASLNVDLTPLPHGSEEFKRCQRYMEATMKANHYRKAKIIDVFAVHRHGSEKRFAEHAKVGNRKLLWHGTSVAVISKILDSGIRIMPHSGGRVGRGLYFADQWSKSAGYTGPDHNQEACMLLNEIVLGKEHHINRDDSSLRKAPNGHHSVVARGWHEPDPTKGYVMKVDGQDVVFPLGDCVPTEHGSKRSSSFDQNEFLVYKESQVKIRYLLRLKFY